jgi:hypothetical protein
MKRITISYRREDSQAITGRIHDRLKEHFDVFRDIDNIPLGIDFRGYVDEQLKKTDLTLVVIGPRWLGAENGRRRIDHPADLVRVEVETALQACRHVVPIFVEGGSPPEPDQLPDSLKNLVYRNGIEVDSGRDFDQHIDRLVRSIQSVLGERADQERGPGEAKRNAEREPPAAAPTAEAHRASYSPAPAWGQTGSEGTGAGAVLFIVIAAIVVLVLFLMLIGGHHHR